MSVTVIPLTPTTLVGRCATCKRRLYYGSLAGHTCLPALARPLCQWAGYA